MKAFFDSSVLVARSDEEHPHYVRSLRVYDEVEAGQGYCGAHTLAEVYATLTALPGRKQFNGYEALIYLADVRRQLTPVTLEIGDYLACLEEAARLRLSSGAIYDALLGQCALKAGVDVIYTWNTKHFLRLGPEIAGRVRVPGA